MTEYIGESSGDECPHEDVFVMVFVMVFAKAASVALASHVTLVSRTFSGVLLVSVCVDVGLERLTVLHVQCLVVDLWLLPSNLCE